VCLYLLFGRILVILWGLCNKKFPENSKLSEERGYKRKIPYDRCNPPRPGSGRHFFLQIRLIAAAALTMRDSAVNPKRMEKNMSDQKKNAKRPGRASMKEFVTVAFAEDFELACQHKKMLEENGICAIVKQPDSSGTGGPGIPVMVSEEDLDQAHALIASQASFEKFFDVFFQSGGRWMDEEIDEDDRYE